MSTGRVAYETARLRLARYRLEGEEDRLRAAAHATQVSAQALSVRFTSVWLFEDQNRKLVCVSAFDQTTGQHTSGGVQSTRDFPEYVAALRERRAIVADDVTTHHVTAAFCAEHLTPRGVCALLDAPIIRSGRVIGVVRHEHTGGPRQWSQRDIDFASSVADMVTLIFEQADRLELEGALQEQAERRQEGQKMEALGRMACAVAHDFNNLLGTIVLTTDAAALVREDPELESLAEQIRQIVETGTRLTNQLLAFGRERSEIKGKTTDLRAVVDHMLPMLKTAVGRSVRIESECSLDRAHVRLEASHVEQILLNLTLNARDAFDHDGVVRIVLRESTPGEDAAPGSFVLSVIDNGPGMDEATRLRAFEPFFTTKPTGTGLGLATVFGVVRRAGGLVQIATTPGSGTTVHVILPPADPE